MGLKYSKDYKISYFDADVQGEMKLPNLLSVALEVSGEQGTKLGRSDHYLMDNFGYGWIVLEYEFIINRLPHYDEEVTIETEATKFNKFFTYRDFTYYDKSGVELVKIHSCWSLMDLEARKIASITDEVMEPYQAEKINRITRGNKYRKLADYDNSRDYHIRYYDLDANGHVNNTRYFDWMIDVLDGAFLEENRPSHIHFKYLKEIHYGNKVESRVQLEDGVSYHEIHCGDEKNAQAEISWRKKDEI